jgi:D-3-phosphoglycerate dehydrogenase
MVKKILVTPKSFKAYKDKAYPLLLEKGYEIIENNLGRTMTEDEIINLAKENVVGIIIGVDPLSARVLEQCTDLKAISKYGVGMDNIDIERAKDLGIKVKNAVGTNNVSVAEAAIGLMFMAARHIYSSVSSVKNGSWDRVMGYELTGKKLGIIGGGQIGKEVAKRACGLAMEITIFDPYFNDDDFLNKYGIKRTTTLQDIFTHSDIISLHVPVTPETKGIVGSDALSSMKPSSFIINTSRGELIDEEALYEALQSKRIAGAAVDVFSSEPPAKEERLLTLDNFILTSHIGAFTHESVERMAMVSTNNLLDMLE